MDQPFLFAGQVVELPVVVVVPIVVVPIVVVVGIVDVVPKVVVGGLIVTVGGWVMIPTVSVVCGPVVTTGIDVAGWLSSSSRVAATATIAPATRATRRRAASAAHSQSGDPLDQISCLRVSNGAGSRIPHSRQYSW